MFPKYFCLKQNKFYFKIINLSHFQELKIIGSKYQLSDIQILKLPERIYLQDLMANGYEISEIEYTEKVNYCIKNLTLIN
ncbi:MAG: hypothetical protein EAZ07_04655 [Cytophagales bacterium]|nr:MAG: hypothetical protein EAZ07_04655 [Cytophagales bacterium]